jgi:hypothetical protein
MDRSCEGALFIPKVISCEVPVFGQIGKVA